jgi:hypothetical protein
MGRGREEAMCEKDEIMQILPGSSSDAAFINLSGTFCNREVLQHHTRSEAGLAILFLTGRSAMEQPLVHEVAVVIGCTWVGRLGNASPVAVQLSTRVTSHERK